MLGWEWTRSEIIDTIKKSSVKTGVRCGQQDLLDKASPARQEGCSTDWVWYKVNPLRCWCKKSRKSWELFFLLGCTLQSLSGQRILRPQDFLWSWESISTTSAWCTSSEIKLSRFIFLKKAKGRVAKNSSFLQCCTPGSWGSTEWLTCSLEMEKLPIILFWKCRTKAQWWLFSYWFTFTLIGTTVAILCSLTLNLKFSTSWGQE